MTASSAGLADSLRGTVAAVMVANGSGMSFGTQVLPFAYKLARVKRCFDVDRSQIGDPYHLDAFTNNLIQRAGN